jgi:hypothetical protein
MLTNTMNLPRAVVLAIQNDRYTKGHADVSVTQLIAPAFQRRLRTFVEPIEDVADKLFALYGQIGHGILEKAGLALNADVETRLFTTAYGWVVSGAYDLFEDGIIFDYKFTTYRSVVSKEPKTEWVQQLNLLNLLARRNGMDVKGLRIIALLRDYQVLQAKRDSSYPQVPIVTLDIPMWDLAITEEFLASRIKAHQDNDPPPCTDEERWMQPEVFALKKRGRKTAIRLFETYQEAESAAASAGGGHFIEHRKGEYKRCTSYCNVAHGCPVFQQSQKEFSHG